MLLENLYFNTPSDTRWHINLLCVALAGLFLYDLVLYADAVLFHRISQPLFEGRASATALAAPLIAIAAARNRRWAIDIHVSRDVVFHSATLVVCGVFLLGLAVTGEIFRRGGAEWGYVAEVSLIFAGVLVVAVLLTSGSSVDWLCPAGCSFTRDSRAVNGTAGSLTNVPRPCLVTTSP